MRRRVGAWPAREDDHDLGGTDPHGQPPTATPPTPSAAPSPASATKPSRGRLRSPSAATRRRPCGRGAWPRRSGRSSTPGAGPTAGTRTNCPRTPPRSFAGSPVSQSPAKADRHRSRPHHPWPPLPRHDRDPCGEGWAAGPLGAPTVRGEARM